MALLGYQMELDPADGGAISNDDSQLVIGMGDMGTLGIFDREGTSELVTVLVH